MSKMTIHTNKKRAERVFHTTHKVLYTTYGPLFFWSHQRE